MLFNNSKQDGNDIDHHDNTSLKSPDYYLEEFDLLPSDELIKKINEELDKNSEALTESTTTLQSDMADMRRNLLDINNKLTAIIKLIETKL